MDETFYPAGARDVWAAIVDVMFAVTVLATFGVSILTLLNNDASEGLARAYARQFRMTTEDHCPRSFGKPFWFACASEARRINGIQPRAEAPAQSRS